MPIYEYQCSRCGVFEVTQRITADPLTKCPTCHHKVQKLISNTSFQLKGSGWYITDYGRGSGANGDKTDKESKSDGASASGDSGKKASTTEKSSDSSTKTSATEKSSGEKSTSSATPSSSS